MGAIIGWPAEIKFFLSKRMAIEVGRYSAIAIIILGGTIQIAPAQTVYYPSTVVNFTPGDNTGISQPYGETASCAGPTSVSTSTVLGAPHACAFLDLTNNGSITLALPNNIATDAVTFYTVNDGAGEVANVYARAKDTAAWTALGQLAENGCCDLNPNPQKFSLSNTNLKSVSQVMVTSLSSAGSFPGLDFMGASVTSTPQTVYLDFSANSQASYTLDALLSTTSVEYAKPDAGLSTTSIAQVVSGVQSIYSGYNVNFTATQPTSGSWETVFIGGTSSDVSAANPSVSIPADVLGIAQSINVMDSNPNATADVFSGAPSFAGPGGIGLLTQVIAHETGHLLGLEHVISPTELLYPYAGAASTGISNSNVPVAKIDNSSKLVVTAAFGFTQNSAADLSCAVGSSAGVVSCSQADSLKSLKVELDSLFSIFDAKLYIVPPGATDDDVGAVEEALGTILSGSDESIYVPEFAGEKIILVGSSIEGGPIDIFAGTSGGFTGDPTRPESLAFQLFDDFGNPALHDVDFYLKQADGSYDNIGFSSLVAASLNLDSVPEPATWIIFLVGLAGLGTWRCKLRGRSVFRLQ